MVPTVASIPDESEEALKVGQSLCCGPSNILSADGLANWANTTEKNCLLTPPVSIPGWPRIVIRKEACLSNLLCL